MAALNWRAGDWVAVVCRRVARNLVCMEWRCLLQSNTMYRAMLQYVVWVGGWGGQQWWGEIKANLIYLTSGATVL